MIDLKSCFSFLQGIKEIGCEYIGNLQGEDDDNYEIPGGELPTARGCGLVHPSYKWINPSLIPSI